MLYKLFVTISFVVIQLFCFSYVEAQNNCRTKLLSEMVKAMPSKTNLLKLESGEYEGVFSYKERPLNVIVSEDRTLLHLGYCLFPMSMRKEMPSPVYNFLERYALCADLSLSRLKTVEQDMVERGIVFNYGSLKELPSIVADPMIEFNVTALNDKYYSVNWSKDNKLCCSVKFPIDNCLLQGVAVDENEQILLDDLKNIKHSECIIDHKVLKEKLTRIIDSEYYIQPGDSIYMASLNSTQYYKAEDMAYCKLVFSEANPVESFANLLLTNNIENDYEVSIKLQMYDRKVANVTVPLCDLLEYFKRNGCKAYFGLVDKTKEQITALLLLIKKEDGYCHTIRFTFHVGDIGNRNGQITGRMSSFIPISRISNIFGEK